MNKLPTGLIVLSIVFLTVNSEDWYTPEEPFKKYLNNSGICKYPLILRLKHSTRGPNLMKDLKSRLEVFFEKNEKLYF